MQMYQKIRFNENNFQKIWLTYVYIKLRETWDENDLNYLKIKVSFPKMRNCKNIVQYSESIQSEWLDRKEGLLVHTFL